MVPRNEASLRAVRHVASLLGGATLITALGLVWQKWLFFVGHHVFVVLEQRVGLTKIVALLLGLGVNVAVWALVMGVVAHLVAPVSKAPRSAP